MEEPEFMENLEKNYGIYLDVNNFVQVLKQKIEEVKNFKNLYENIGTDLCKDKTELQLIKEAYAKAREKGYIRDPNENQM